MRFEIGDQLNFGLRNFDFGFIFDWRAYGNVIKLGKQK
jgi:hypothetical protein